MGGTYGYGYGADRRGAALRPPPLIPTQTLAFGALTAASAGGIAPTNTGGPVTSWALVSAGSSLNATTHFQINASTGKITPTSAGDTADLSSGPYTLVVRATGPGGVSNGTLTINVLASAYSVAVSTGEAELLAAAQKSTLAYGQTIYLRDGDYNRTKADLRITRTVAIVGTFTGSNHVVITPHAGAIANLWRLGHNGFAIQNNAIRYLGLVLCAENDNTFNGTNGSAVIWCNNAASNICVDSCLSNTPAYAPTASVKLPYAIRLPEGSGHKIINNIFRGFDYAVGATGNDLVIENNYFYEQLEDDCNLSKPLARLSFRFNRFYGHRDYYEPLTILGVTRGATTLVQLSPADAAKISTSYDVLTLVGMTGLDQLEKYYVGPGSYSVNTGTGVVTISVNSTGYNAWISGGVLRHSSIHADHLQVLGTGGVLGDFDDMVVEGNIFGFPSPLDSYNVGCQGFWFSNFAAGVTCRRLSMRGNTYYGMSANGLYIDNIEDATIAFNTVIGVLDVAQNPAQQPKISIGVASGANKISYNACHAITITTGGGTVTQTGNVTITYQNSTAYNAAFVRPPLYADAYNPLSDLAMKTGGTLDTAPYKAGAIGTGYVDFVARTTAFPAI